mmetsp:Transcript_76700/g.155876  ORF Transcript_76700/g.155876 Transcript_76700/m.155876 type:complete len:375 (-) Transcript_76700:363-1487(-)
MPSGAHHKPIRTLHLFEGGRFEWTTILRLLLIILQDGNVSQDIPSTFLGNGLQWQRNHHCAHGFMYKIRHLQSHPSGVLELLELLRGEHRDGLNVPLARDLPPNSQEVQLALESIHCVLGALISHVLVVQPALAGILNVPILHAATLLLATARRICREVRKWVVTFALGPSLLDLNFFSPLEDGPNIIPQPVTNTTTEVGVVHLRHLLGWKSGSDGCHFLHWPLGRLPGWSSLRNRYLEGVDLPPLCRGILSFSVSFDPLFLDFSALNVKLIWKTLIRLPGGMWMLLTSLREVGVAFHEVRRLPEDQVKLLIKPKFGIHKGLPWWHVIQNTLHLVPTWLLEAFVCGARILPEAPTVSTDGTLSGHKLWPCYRNS